MTNIEKLLVSFPFFFVLFAPIAAGFGLAAGAIYLSVTGAIFTALAIRFAWGEI